MAAWAIVLAGAWAAAARSADAAPRTVGQAETVVAAVSGTLEGARREIAVRDSVFHQEEIATGADAASRLRFLDDTVLSIGPASRLVLDRFVFDPDAGQSLHLRALAGVFRVFTGRLDKRAYEIRTPSATIGVRGTIFVLAIAPDGTTRIDVESGSVVATGPSGAVTEIPAGYSATIGPSTTSAGPTTVARSVLPAAVLAMDRILERVGVGEDAEVDRPAPPAPGGIVGPDPIGPPGPGPAGGGPGGPGGQDGGHGDHGGKGGRR